MSKLFAKSTVAASVLLALSGCASNPASESTPTPAPAPAPAGDDAVAAAPDLGSKRSLASFLQPSSEQTCFNRDTEPYTAVVDSHFHPRPFGGQAIPPETLFAYLDKAGVRFINYFGIGQILDMKSDCTYYLDCPGVSALPSIKNDFVNGMQTKAFPHDNLNIILSMTFIDLANPQGSAEMIALYDKEYPGMFKWAGELNVIKQALLKNNHQPATMASIDQWAPFMKVLRERGIPVTLHSDLGNDAEPTKFLPLMQHILETYPDNKIVWAHMGLSKELSKMPPDKHIAIMKGLLDKYPNLMLDISWDVLYNSYHEFGPQFVAFFDEYPTRILPGSDFVAAVNKAPTQYAKELDVTSRVNKFLGDEAFRHIALGENYFRLLDLPYHAPEICE